MRDPARIPLVLNALQRRWEAQPDLRLGQLLSNVTHDRHLAAIEDGALLELLGASTGEERDYVQREPKERQRGWREWCDDRD